MKYLTFIVGLISLNIDAQSWHPIDQGLGTVSRVNTILEKDGWIYLGGSGFRRNGNSLLDDDLLITNGTSWGVPTCPSISGNKINAMVVYEGNLVVGGYFNDEDVVTDPSLRYIALWDGKNWSALGEGLNDDVDVMFVDGGDLYVGGDFTDAGGNTNADYIARWDGEQWHSLGAGVSSNQVYSITKFQDEIYIGGGFCSVNGDQLYCPSLARWNGVSWNTLNDCYRFGCGTEVFSLETIDDKLYIGSRGYLHAGDCTGNQENIFTDIFTYDGISFQAVGTEVDGAVFAITEHENVLYIGGDFSDAGGDQNANNLAKWNGSDWESTGLTFPYNADHIRCLLSVDEDLYVGGEFRTLNSNNSMNGLIRYGPIGETCDIYGNLSPCPEFHELLQYNLESASMTKVTDLVCGESYQPYVVCADGTKSLILKHIIGSWKIRNSTSNSDYEGRLIVNGQTCYTEYQAPTMDLNQQIILDYFPIEGCNPSITLSLVIKPPPVLLIHGIRQKNGDVAWQEVRDFLIQSGWDPKFISSPTYNTTQPFSHVNIWTKDKLEILLSSLRVENVFVNKAAIVGYSMGGLVARSYLESVSPQTDLTCKLITVNTPHAGSELANFALGGNPVGFLLGIFLFGPNPSNWQGVASLRVNSPEVQALNELPEEGPVFAAIGSNSNLYELLGIFCLQGAGQTATIELVFYNLVRAVATVNFLIVGTTACLLLSDLLFDLLGTENDGVVRLTSQLGGLMAGSQVPFEGTFSTFHTSVLNNQNVIEKIKNMLSLNMNDSEFSEIGFTPTELQYSIQPTSNSRSASTISVSVTGVENDQVFHMPSENLIHVSGNEDVSALMILYFYGNSYELGLVDTSISQSNVFKFKSPPNYSGDMDIVVIGTDGLGDLDYKHFKINVIYQDCPGSIVLPEGSIFDGHYFADQITSSSEASPGTNIVFDVGEFATLRNGFEVKYNTTFEIITGGCP